MSDYTITIPEELYIKAKSIADETESSVEEVIQNRLASSLQALLPVDEEDELKALAYLSDDTLWTIAREQVPQSKQKIMHELMTKNSLGTINEEEYKKLETYAELNERLILRKSEAMRLLILRGYSVTFDDLAPTNE